MLLMAYWERSLLLQHLFGVLHIAEIPKCIASQAVADELLEFFWELARDSRWDGEILILFLTKPAKVITHLNADAWFLRVVCPATVTYRAGKKHDRALRHCRRYGFFGRRRAVVLPFVTTRDHPRRAVLFCEITERPHGVALAFHAARKAEGAIYQLIAMKRLAGLSRINSDCLSQMKLELLAVGTKHFSGGVEHQGVHGKLVERLRAGDQTSCAL